MLNSWSNHRKALTVLHPSTYSKSLDFVPTLQSYDRPAMNNCSYHARDWSSVSERSVYQLHEHGTVFLSTFAPPATPLPSRRIWKLSFSVKHFSFPPPCSLDYHSFINCTLSVQGWSATTVIIIIFCLPTSTKPVGINIIIIFTLGSKDPEG